MAADFVGNARGDIGHGFCSLNLIVRRWRVIFCKTGVRFVSGERVVFNIKGNDYRLVVAINYHYQILLTIWLGTHQEYDKIDVTKVAYEKERYANPSNSN